MNVQHNAGKTGTSDEADSSNSAEADPPEPASTSAIPEIDVCFRAGANAGISASRLRETVACAVGELGARVARLGVELIDDEAMRRLHERTCGVAEPTDVLTFPLNGAGAPIDADIAVNVDEAARQALARGHSTEREVLLYVLHGVLHCAGFDDRDPEDYQAMHAEEDRILAAIGVGRTFGVPRSEAAP